jgi:hypothetical protein
MDRPQCPLIEHGATTSEKSGTSSEKARKRASVGEPTRFDFASQGVRGSSRAVQVESANLFVPENFPCAC